MFKRIRPKKRSKPAQPRVKLQFKKHLLPPLGGLVVAIFIFGVLNSQYLSGQVAYYVQTHSHKTQAAPAQPKKPADNNVITIDKNAPPAIAIAKISVNAPVIYGLETTEEKVFQNNLHNGVVQYPGTALPGQAGNIVIFGHSSGRWWAPGNYKFVFSLLEKLDIDDEITLDYQGIRYVYHVTAKRVVTPDNLGVLNSVPSEHKLTLLTCTPVGTNSKRLVIEARQVSPNPNQSAAEPLPATPGADAPALPSSAPSLWSSIRSLF
jgi:LPXTG-site transpeptidase (sortase) family protein